MSNSSTADGGVPHGSRPAGGGPPDDGRPSGFGLGAIASILGRGIGRGLTIVFQIAVARRLTPSAYGLFSLGWTVFRMLGVFATAGLNNGVVRVGAAHAGDRAALRRVLWCGVALALGFGSLVAGALLAGQSMLSRAFVDSDALVATLGWLAIALPAFSVVRAAAAVILVGRRSLLSIACEDMVPALLAIIVLFALPARPEYAAVAVLVGYAAVAVVAVTGLRARLAGPAGPTPRGSMLRRLLGASLPTAGAASATLFTLWIDRIFLGLFSVPEVVGHYQAASQLAVLFMIVSNGLNTVLGPAAARMLARGAASDLQSVYTATTRWGMYLGLPAFVTIAACPGELLAVVFGAAYADARLVFVILATGQCARLLLGSPHVLLIMGERQVWWFVYSGAGFALALALHPVVTRQAGAAGAALVTSLCLLLPTAAAALDVRRHVGVWPWQRASWKPLVGCAASASVAALVAGLAATPFARLAVVALAAHLVFFATVVALGLPASERRVLARLGGRGDS